MDDIDERLTAQFAPKPCSTLMINMLLLLLVVVPLLKAFSAMRIKIP
jgi:hypothetical protein